VWHKIQEITIAFDIMIPCKIKIIYT